MSIIRRDGFDFAFEPDACTTCPSRCCRGKSGRVWLNHRDFFQIRDFLKMNDIDFIQRYLNRIDNRLSIKERFTGHDFGCIFLEGPRNRCSIYKVRPLQCRQFPFWDYFRKHKKQAIEECPGIRE